VQQILFERLAASGTLEKYHVIHFSGPKNIVLLPFTRYFNVYNLGSF